MKLKTLKDIGFFTEVRNVPNVFKKSKIEAVFKDELKAEAIKWGKKFGIEFTLYDFLDFFNITEEDLKS